MNFPEAKRTRWSQESFKTGRLSWFGSSGTEGIMFQSEQVRWGFTIPLQAPGISSCASRSRTMVKINPAGSWINFLETNLSFLWSPSYFYSHPTSFDSMLPLFEFPSLSGSQGCSIYHLPCPSFSCWGVKGHSVLSATTYHTTEGLYRDKTRRAAGNLWEAAGDSKWQNNLSVWTQRHL